MVPWTALRDVWKNKKEQKRKDKLSKKKSGPVARLSVFFAPSHLLLRLPVFYWPVGTACVFCSAARLWPCSSTAETPFACSFSETANHVSVVLRWEDVENAFTSDGNKETQL